LQSWLPCSEDKRDSDSLSTGEARAEGLDLTVIPVQEVSEDSFRGVLRDFWITAKNMAIVLRLYTVERLCETVSLHCIV
jgi:hypothetical protein